MATPHNAIASSSKLPAPSSSKKHKKKAHSSSAPQPNSSARAVAPGPAIPNGTSSHKRDKSIKSKEKHSHAQGHGHGNSKSDKTGPYEHRRMRMRLSIPPRYSGEYMLGVKEQLDGMVMRYVPQVQGVLLAHWEHTFLDDTVDLINECPFGVVDVQFETLIWAPKLGQKLYGTHSLSSPSHLSLLFSRTFNISIPLQHIPQETYEFQPTNPDELDEESDSGDEDEVEDGLLLGSALGLNGHGGARGQVEEVGRWKVRETGKLVGEGGKGVKFTVIGMQVTNQMLSLTGSLLSDPTNPPPAPTVTAAPAPIRNSPTPDIEVPPPSARPAKQPRPNKQAPQPARSQAPVPAPNTTAAPVLLDEKEEIDDSFLSARDLKRKRKEDKKRKNDARKEKRAERELEVEQAVGGGMAVRMNGDVPELKGEGLEAQKGGVKRKGGEVEEGGKKKKRKEKSA